MFRGMMILVAIITFMLSAPAVWGEGFTETKLLPSDGAAGDNFGMRVSIDGHLAVVSSDHDDDHGADSGSVHVFRFDTGAGTWDHEAKLLASDGAAGDRFGIACSVFNGVIVVGAQWDDNNGNNSGSAYVFRYNTGTGTWDEEEKLLPADGAAEDCFGTQCSISNDVIVVGSRYDDDNGSNSGSAYVFRYNAGTGTWDEEAKLLASDGASGDSFGMSVSNDGDVIVVGAYWDDEFGTDSGSAYVFRYDSITGTWSEEAELLPSDGAAGDQFGTVSISGNTALVSALHDNASTGAAYVFRYDPGTESWPEEDKLLAHDGAADDWFGSMVCLKGNMAVIGAREDDDNGTDSGSAYIFRYNSGTGTWTEDSKLLPSDGAGGDEFGVGVAVSGDFILVGARYIVVWENWTGE
ncbi:MAG: FG-GAP repeat protein [Deltaproteobacteria bacterium]|nr:FG-GAP repeat protein [Deltaproteobacteria bacterium]